MCVSERVYMYERESMGVYQYVCVCRESLDICECLYVSVCVERDCFSVCESVHVTFKIAALTGLAQV